MYNKTRLKYWYVFSLTKKIVDKAGSFLNSVVTFIVYIPILFVVIILLFMAGERR